MRRLPRFRLPYNAIPPAMRQKWAHNTQHPTGLTVELLYDLSSSLKNDLSHHRGIRSEGSVGSDKSKLVKHIDCKPTGFLDNGRRTDLQHQRLYSSAKSMYLLIARQVLFHIFHPGRLLPRNKLVFLARDGTTERVRSKRLLAYFDPSKSAQ